MGNRNLVKARVRSEDEYYTRLSDIENELKHYKHHFKDKVVLCNCDDPFESNFFKYFAMNFNYLGLKKLICTCYDGSAVSGTQLSIFDDFNEETTRTAHKIEICEVDDFNNDGAVNLSDVEYLLKNKKNVLSKLNGNGDFRSEECIELLKEADIVVTNPPFSLFREYVATLILHEKKFLIIGNKNAIGYKEFFPLIKQDKVWVGYTSPKEFYIPKEIDRQNVKKGDGGVLIAKFGNIGWYTNLDISKKHESLLENLYKHYSPEEFPTYDNYDAIEVGEISEIPCDYFGIMGVPVTFLDKYNPDEFEIVGASQTGCHPIEMVTKRYGDYWGVEQSGRLNGRTGSTLGQNPVLVKDDKKHVYYVNSEGRRVQSTYGRLFIRRKQ